MVSMSQSVTLFQKAEEFNRLSVSAKKRQMINLRRLLTEITPQESTARLTRAHIDGVLNQARQRGVEESTLNVYRTDLRRFTKWLLVCQMTKTDHSAHLVNMKTKTPPSKRKPVSRDQAGQMIDLATAMHPRDGMTILILLETGLREVEVVGLTWGQIDLQLEESTVYRSKIRDYHPVFYTPQLTQGLIEWKRYYERLHGPIQPNWYVVPARAAIHEGSGRQRQKMNPDWPMVPTRPQWNIAKRVKSLLRDVGETDLRGRASHTLRRTAGNLLHQDGADIRVLQDFYGHGSAMQTEQYLDIDVRRKTRRDFLRNRPPLRRIVGSATVTP
jgi:integrase